MSTPPPQLTNALRSFLQRAQQPPGVQDSTVARNVNLTFSFDGGGAPVLVGQHCYLPIDLPCKITGWKIVGDTAGSISFEVDGGSFAGFPTLAALQDGTGLWPATAGTQSAEADISVTPTALDGWTTVVSKGDVLHAVVTANDTMSVVTLSLRAKRLDIF
jgi:hypothetical protein